MKLIKPYLELLPVLAAVLIFMGYWNLSTFYREFDIQIQDYISTGEIITSFLPIIQQIILAIVTICIIIASVFILSLFADSVKETEADEETSSVGFSPNLRLVLQPAFKKTFYRRRFWSVVQDLFTILLSAAIGALMYVAVVFLYNTGFGPFINRSPRLADESGDFIGRIAVGTMILLFIIQRLFEDQHGKKIEFKKYPMAITLAVVFSIALLNQLLNISKAVELKTAIAKQDVRFVFQGTEVKSDSNTVYLGRTSGYLFLYDRAEKRKLIYQTSGISLFEQVTIDTSKAGLTVLR